MRIEVNDSFTPEQEDNHYTDNYRFPPIANEYDNTLIKQYENKLQILAEYSYPITEKSTFEAGYDGNLNKTDDDYHVEYLDPSQNKFVTDLTKTSHFLYNEDIHAIYTTYSNSFGNLGMLAGLRAESSSIKANLLSRDSIITNQYFNIYPTLHLSYKLDEILQLQLNYSKRANRAEGDDLNPFPEYQDPRNIKAGNPRLKPEFIHSLEFGLQWLTDYVTVVPSVFYRNRYNGLTVVTKAVNDTTLLTTKENLTSDQSAGFEIILSGTSGKFLSANLSGNAFYEIIDASNLGFSNTKSTMSWSGNMSCNMNLSTKTMFQINANYKSARLTPQGEFKPSFVANMGFRQDLLDDQLTLFVTVSDIFKSLKREMSLDTPWLSQYTVNQRDSRIFFLGLTYHIGKPSKKSKEKSMQYDNEL